MGEPRRWNGKVGVGMERIEGGVRRIGKENGRDWRSKKKEYKGRNDHRFRRNGKRRWQGKTNGKDGIERTGEGVAWIDRGIDGLKQYSNTSCACLCLCIRRMFMLTLLASFTRVGNLWQSMVSRFPAQKAETTDTQAIGHRYTLAPTTTGISTVRQTTAADNDANKPTRLQGNNSP